jgi:rhodanese-related sulfurtransferase
VELWSHQADATVYCFDVRSPEEFERGHLAGFRNAPGGQLVQETDMFAPVRNARIVLADDDGVRANMTASWLAQMNWKVAVVDGLTPDDFRINGPWRNPLPPSPLPPGTEVSAAEVRQWQSGTGERIAVLDLSPHRQYARRHIPGSVFIQRAHLEQALEVVRDARKIVPVFLLQGGVDAWVAEGLRADATLPQYACQPTDRYQRPYEGKDVDAGTMQAYLDWEYGLVEQLERDGTHGFFVL